MYSVPKPGGGSADGELEDRHVSPGMGDMVYSPNEDGSNLVLNTSTGEILLGSSSATTQARDSVQIESPKIYPLEAADLELQNPASEELEFLLQSGTLPLEPRQAFVGTWKLDKSRSDKPEAQLVELGVSWFRRQAAKVARPTVTITLDSAGRDSREEVGVYNMEGGGVSGMVWEEEIVAGKVFRVRDSLLLDGTKVLKTKEGERAIEMNTVEEGGACVVTRYSLPEKEVSIEIRRYVIDEDLEKGVPETYFVKNKMTTHDGRYLLRNTYFTKLT